MTVNAATLSDGTAETSNKHSAVNDPVSLDYRDRLPPSRAVNGGREDGTDPMEAQAELDDFGLPIRPKPSRVPSRKGSEDGSGDETFDDAEEQQQDARAEEILSNAEVRPRLGDQTAAISESPSLAPARAEQHTEAMQESHGEGAEGEKVGEKENGRSLREGVASSKTITDGQTVSDGPEQEVEGLEHVEKEAEKRLDGAEDGKQAHTRLRTFSKPGETSVGGVSEWSHQVLAPREEKIEEQEEDEWQDMPAYGKHDLYDDWGRLLVKGAKDFEEDDDAYEGENGAGRGYTRVQIDEDARSATSMDENTSYLFKDKGGGTNVADEDEEVRDPLAQMQATKDMLTEGQRIAYVGVTRLSVIEMGKNLEITESTKGTKKDLTTAVESLQMWGQKMMVRLYSHMDIDSSEQVMIEQLAEHGVQPADLTPALMRNSRVKNPMANQSSPTSVKNGRLNSVGTASVVSEASGEDGPPPPYEIHPNEGLPEVRNPGSLPTTRDIDIDLRWTVLCDLFLVLIADSIYDARSRVLLETVGLAMDITWMDICRFEKRVTDALEMQEEAARENWDEGDHMEARRKMTLKRKYVMMGLATVGGSLVIGLSAGLLAPVIGAGLAAGFTTIGVAGTGTFLTGAGGAALIASGAAVSGGTIAVRASGRRLGAVKTFEYRPLHNNKRVNLVLTVSGWMNGKVDDVRLPFSTVDPIMGDMYSLFWEPDMLRSTGDTIRILATEALTQGLQQVLASTILTALMASLTLPIVLTKLSYLIDNPWSVSLGRADAAGLILADSIIDRHLGLRPITLVGFSLGSRLIFSCLKELASRGAYGLVQNVYMFGSPVVAKQEEYQRARTVVAGRFVNGYASNDWILGYLFRATSGGISRVSGLAPVENIPGLENVSVTEIVNGHMAYRAAMPRLLREVGWEMESDEFTEIEDPDPENHEARQRQLIREIEDAREEAKMKPDKKKRWWSKKGADKAKKGWETYDEKSSRDESGKATEDGGDKRLDRVLFDVDAIRRELESEHMDVRQLESTLPPVHVQLDKASPGASGASTPRGKKGPTDHLRQSSSFQFPHRSRSSASLPARGTSVPRSRTSTPPVAPPPPKSGYNHAPNYDYDEFEDEFRPSGDDGDDDGDGDDAAADAAADAGITMVFDDHQASPPPRPALRSAKTMPAAPLLPSSFHHHQHNAWADDSDHDRDRDRSRSHAGGYHYHYDYGDDDEDLHSAGEGDIKMTFA